MSKASATKLVNALQRSNKRRTLHREWRKHLKQAGYDCTVKELSDALKKKWKVEKGAWRAQPGITCCA